MQTHHLIPLATQLLDYANPSPKLWLTFSLKTNHLVQSSQCDLHSHPDLAVEPDHLFMIKDEADYTKNNMHHVWNA